MDVAEQLLYAYHHGGGEGTDMGLPSGDLQGSTWDNSPPSPFHCPNVFLPNFRDIIRNPPLHPLNNSPLSCNITASVTHLPITVRWGVHVGPQSFG